MYNMLFYFSPFLFFYSIFLTTFLYISSFQRVECTEMPSYIEIKYKKSVGHITSDLGDRYIIGLSCQTASAFLNRAATLDTTVATCAGTFRSFKG